MFARQRDTIIRSDVTSGVHSCYSGSLSQILFYVRIVLLLPGIYHPINLPA